MPQKNVTPTRDQQAAIKRAGLDPREWTVKKELYSQLIICHRITGSFQVINKNTEVK